MYYVYILQSQVNSSLYKGQTKDLASRIKRHNAGYEQATSRYAPWSLVWYSVKSSRAEAMALEKKIKGINKQRTIDFINKYPVDVDSGPDVTAVR